MSFGPPTLLELTRRARHWSATRLAAEAKVDRAILSRAEAGALPSIASRTRLAEALNTTPDALWPLDANGRAEDPADAERR